VASVPSQAPSTRWPASFVAEVEKSYTDSGGSAEAARCVTDKLQTEWTYPAAKTAFNNGDGVERFIADGLKALSDCST
jgi:hypothetical protein